VNARACSALLLVLAVAAFPSTASQTRVLSVDGAAALLGGDLDGAALDGDGVVSPGPEQRVLVDGIAGAVLALARGGDGGLYAATGGPGRVYRVDGGRLDVVWESDKPLVTALLPLGRDRLVALTAPDGGAEIIELASRKRTSVPAKEAKLLLAGVVVDGVVYAAGGGDDGGVLLKLAVGGKDAAAAWTVVARTKQELRSLAATTTGGRLRFVAGSSDEGFVYELIGEGASARVRTLLDASPAEVTGIALGAEGAVFAAFVDSEGRLSKQATARAKEDGDDDEKKGRKPKARKVKGGEVWRIDADGAARVLYQSKEHGPYAVAVDARGHVLVGTGPEGRIVDVDGRGQGRPGVWTRRSGNDEITALLVEKAGVVAGASHGGAVLGFGPGAAQNAAYLSPSLDADGRARWGLVRVTAEKGAPRVALRTGNTREPDETWSDWSPAQPAGADGVTLPGLAAPFAQVKVELAGGATITAVHVAALVDNRAPEIDAIDVLAPGWKVVPSPRDPPETRSVTFGEKPFARFLDRRGAQNPTLEERPYGKQSFDVGYRTVYAYVEDADKDALRYRFALGEAGANGAVASWRVVQDWSEAPFVSFEASRLKDGVYRVKVDVDDSPTNGPTRALSDSRVSARFVVSHDVPRFVDAKALRDKAGVRVQLSVEAALPLVAVRCSTKLNDWLPLDPKDGILDGRTESFDVVLPGEGADAASCEVYDEALNFGRLDLPVR
jgi:hypothetical protein